jgi:hypothetical protein
VSIIAAFMTPTGVLLAGESICQAMSGARLPAVRKLLQTGWRSGAAFVGCTGWTLADGSYMDARACLTAHCEQLRSEPHASVQDQAHRLAAAIAITSEERPPGGRAAQYFSSVKDGQVVLMLTAGFDPSGSAALGISRVRYDSGRFVPAVQSGPPSRMVLAWPARTPTALEQLHSKLSEIADPGVQAVMAGMKSGAPLPTAHEARSFFGHLVQTAINLQSDEFIPASWPIHTIEITRGGISEQRYACMDDLRASAGLSAALVSGV